MDTCTGYFECHFVRKSGMICTLRFQNWHGRKYWYASYVCNIMNVYDIIRVMRSAIIPLRRAPSLACAFDFTIICSAVWINHFISNKVFTCPRMMCPQGICRMSGRCWGHVRGDGRGSGIGAYTRMYVHTKTWRAKTNIPRAQTAKTRKNRPYSSSF